MDCWIAMSGRKNQRFIKRSAALALSLLFLLTVASCFDPHLPTMTPSTLPTAWPGAFVQKGTVALRDGEQVKVSYKVPFQSPPRLVITGFNQSWFKKKPYSLNDFEIVEQEAGYFKIENRHSEPGGGSWAVLEWRAEGAKGSKLAAAKTPQERAVAIVEDLKGRVTFDQSRPEKPLIGIDLNKTRVTDSDLAILQGLTTLRTLNLYGTSITDAGMSQMSGLTGLQTLHLSHTAITDAGLRNLQQLPNLRELNLFHTGVSDVGVQHLKGLHTLQDLTLGETQVTDQCIVYLKEMRSLKHVSLARTHVTNAGVQELQRAQPALRIIR